MERAYVVRGTLQDPTHIELDEPVTELRGSIEVVIRRPGSERAGASVSAYQRWAAAFDRWVDSHDQPAPGLSEDALRREELYGDRL